MLIKTTLSFKNLYMLVLKHLDDEEKRTSFKQSFSYHLLLESDILSQKLPTPDDYAAALRKALSDNSVKFSPFALELLDVLLSSAKLPTKPKQKVDEAKPSAVTTAVKKTASHKQSVSLLPVPKTTVLNSVAKEKPLSSKSVGIVRSELLAYRKAHPALYRNCKILDCSVCITAFEKVPLTKCTHKNHCTKSGLFPHLARSTLTVLHNNRSVTINELHCASRHWTNPCSVEKSQAVQITPTPSNLGMQALDAMEQDFISKKRKLGIEMTGLPARNVNPQNPPVMCPCGHKTKKNSRGNRNCSINNCPTWAALKSMSHVD